MLVCDNCNQQGVRANGKDIKDHINEVVMWFCYNCLESVRAECGVVMP